MKKSILIVVSILTSCSASFAQVKPAPVDTAKKVIPPYVVPLNKVTTYSFNATPGQLANFLYILQHGTEAIDQSRQISAADATGYKRDYKNIADSLIIKYNSFLEKDHAVFVADSLKKLKALTAGKK